MAAKALEPVPKEEKKSTARISFKTAKEMQNAVGDLELKENITLTITGTITSLSMHNEDSWQDNTVELDVSSVSGKTHASEVNEKEMNDMTEEKE